jgi:ankyrin repeat protein
MTPLMNAARIADLELLKLLVDRGAAVDARDARGRSALWYAAAAGHGPSVSLLLSARASPDAADREGTTSLLAAVRSGSLEALEKLLTAGADADAKVPPLNAAAAMGRLDMVAALLARKPPLDKLDSFGDTALMAAARNGDEATSLHLLAAGANPRLRNRERATAADLAEARGFHTLAQRLRD